MNIRKNTFAAIFRRLRVLSGFFSLTHLSDQLYYEGLNIDQSILSRWQTGKRIPRCRKTILIIIKMFYLNGGIENEKVANEMLEAAEMGYMTNKERAEIFQKRG